MFKLDHNASLVTGGGSGIGKAFAHLFVQQGFTLCVLDIDETGAKETVGTIKSNGHYIVFCCLYCPGKSYNLVQ